MKTIKSRMIGILIICLLFISVSVLFSWKNIFDLKEKVTLIESFDDLRGNLLELRRQEKNYFLAKDLSSLDKMMFFLSQTEAEFNALKSQIKKIMGSDKYKLYKIAFINYKRVLAENTDKTGSGSAANGDEELRAYGKALNDYTDQLIAAKRKNIERTLDHMLAIPILFSAIFLVSFIIILRITKKDVLEPLLLLKEASEKIAKGTFEPVRISVDRCDEISNCLTAFNKMAHEIETHQAQLLQSRKMASIGTFTSGIAHELNNPINNISLIVDSLLEDGDTLPDEERKSLYNDLMVQADRSSDIVRSLLDFSRTDQEHLEKIPLEDLVDKTTRLVKNELQLQHIKLVKEKRGEILPVWIDKNRLQQALLNILINAIQAMPDGGSLGISMGPGDASGEMRIDISDTGKGIPADQIDLIFDPFFTTRKEGEGTGLGLSVTYGIIRKHGGRITAQSTPGKGTCFSIFLNTGVGHE